MASIKGVSGKRVRFNERVTVFHLDQQKRSPSSRNVVFAFAFFLFVFLAIRGIESHSRRLSAATETIEAITPNLRATALKLNEARAAFLDRP